MDENQVNDLLQKMNAIQQQLAQQETARQQASMDAARSAAAQKYGLPDVLANRLQGDTPQAIEADAASLAKLTGASTAQPSASKLPSTPEENADLVERIYSRISGKPKPGSNPFFSADFHRTKGGN